TGDLYTADVGQNAREEINFQPASSTGGENYGWRCYEGNNTFNTSGCPTPGSLDFPILDYSHASGNCSVTGGIVYRGCALPELDGTYFFADYCSGILRGIQFDGTNIVSDINYTSQIGGGFGIASFGADALGEMYITRTTTVERVVRAGGPLEDCDANGVEDACQARAGNPPPCLCPADTNGDGELNPADFNAWIAAFNAGAAQCDQNADGNCDPSDFNAWIANFNAGC
ncbi:MAG: GC-type dockerin domain-anchored protein, partial [Planctomycetota bacterium]